VGSEIICFCEMSIKRVISVRPRE